MLIVQNPWYAADLTPCCFDTSGITGTAGIYRVSCSGLHLGNVRKYRKSLCMVTKKDGLDHACLYGWAMDALF